MKTLLYFFFGLFLVRVVTAEDPGDESAQVPRFIQNAVPYIEKKGADWIEKRNCLSCHHTSFMTWSLNSAQKLGLKVNTEKLDESNTWATQWQHHIKPEQREKASREKTMLGASDTIAQLILGNTYLATGHRKNAPYAAFLLAAQNGEGSWKAGGQLPRQRRPARETQEVSTMWVMLALQDSDLSADEIGKALELGYSWLGDKTAGISTEWWAVRTALERSLGNVEKADHFLTKLNGHQHEDGGWGWLCDDESDALGTGIALYVLAREGIPKSNQSVQKALQFLHETQEDDGSWPVPGTKEGDEDEIKWTAVFWGTCWAVIGASQYAK